MYSMLILIDAGAWGICSCFNAEQPFRQSVFKFECVQLNRMITILGGETQGSRCYRFYSVKVLSLQAAGLKVMVRVTVDYNLASLNPNPNLKTYLVLLSEIILCSLGSIWFLMRLVRVGR